MMNRRLSVTLLLVSLAFVVSCSSKKPKSDDAAAANGTPDDSAKISQEALSFPADGSDSGKVAGLNTIHFSLDSSTLDETNRKILADNADWVKKNSNLSVQIEGHCDKRGSVEYNLALGERRAKSVRDYLVSLGVDAKHLQVISYGKEKPIDAGDGEAAMKKNRRANFVPLNN